MENLAVEWLQSQIVFESVDKELLARWDEDSDLSEYFDKAKEMEKKQRDTLLKYIEEVRDLCGKLRFPTEEELRELTMKADVILETFKEEEQ
jgi:hypothetical protein